MINCNSACTSLVQPLRLRPIYAPAGLRETSGTQLVIDGTKISAVMTAELESLGGNYFAVEAQIPRRWIVDAVEVQPADSFSDRTLTADGPNRQLLRLNLQRALHEDALRPLRVVIRAHHRLPSANQPFEADFYRVATFADVHAARRLAAVRTTEAGARLQWIGDERLTRLDPLQLPEAEMRLFEAVPGTILFADDAESSGLAAQLATAAPAFRMEVNLEARVAKRQTQQALAMRCIPESSPVGELVVRLSPRPAGAIDWKLTGDDQRELSVTPLSAAPADGAEGADAVYRLALVPPRSAPFEVAAQWSSPAADSTSLCLAAVPEAKVQSGIITVRSLDGSPVRVEAEGVDSLPIAQSDPEQFSTLRGRYSYRPGGRASLRILPAGREAAAAAIRIESLHVQSQFSTDGKGDHAAFLRLINEGAVQLNLRLPAGILDLRQVDGESSALLPLPRPSSGIVAVPLPAGQRRVDVRLRYTSARSPLGWQPWGHFEAPLPKPEVVPLARTWTVALGPGLEASGLAGGVPGDFRLLPTAFMATPLAATALTEVARGAGGNRTGPPELELAGWMRYELPLPAGPQASIRVIRSRVVSGLSISLFLLVAIATLRIAARATAWTWLGVVAMLVVAILTPHEWALLAGGAARWGSRSGPLARSSCLKRQPRCANIRASACGARLSRCLLPH